MKHVCPYCCRSQPRRSAAGYLENPFCRWCLHERVERAVAGVAQHVEQDVIDKLRELRHLIQHATDEDSYKLPEMSRWFDTFLSRATPAEKAEFRKAVRRMWPIAVTVLIEEAQSGDPEAAAGARLALEKMKSLREGGTN